MSRDRYSPQDDESDDIIRFQTPSRSPLERRRQAREEKLRRIRPSTPPREREGRYRESDQTDTRPRQARSFREDRGEHRESEEREEERERPYRQEPPEPLQEPHSTRPIREDRYREREARTTRPRPTRDPGEYDYPEERYTTTPRRRDIDTGMERDTDYRTYRHPVRRSGTRSSPPEPATRTRRRRARRSVWSTLLVGVLGGLITIALVVGIGWFLLIHTLQMSFPGLGIGTSTYVSPQQSVPLNITSTITQLQVTDYSGNIAISDNSATTGGTLTYVKKTQATSSSAAASDFARIQVQALPGNSAACPATSCMTVNVNAPQTILATVDLTLVLPAQSPSPPFVLNAKSTQTGDISVQNFSGLLSLSGNIGNISVKGGLLDSGSCLQTIKGNITFAGTLATGVAPTINPCHGNPVTTSNSTQPWYTFSSGTGNVDASLNSISANIILDATVFNQGKISSEYPITIPPGNPPSYDGPLMPGTNPSAMLLITVDTGNITLHKV